MSVLVTVLGRYSPFAPIGGACAGYIVQSGDITLMLDGGPGALSRMQVVVNPLHLTAVLVSHLHPDHIADLHSLQYLMRELEDQRGPVPVYAPDVPSPDRHWLESVKPGSWQELHPLPVETGISFGNVLVTFARADHPLPCWAMRITDGSSTLVYTADTGSEVDLAPFAQGADLLIAESTYAAANGQIRRGHMMASEAADLANRAGVKRLLLTHFRPSTPIGEAEAEAREVFPASEAAVEMRSYLI